MCEIQQFIGRVAHSGDHNNDVVAGFTGRHDPFGDPLDPLGIHD
jgi:hypothetical protein